MTKLPLFFIILLASASASTQAAQPQRPARLKAVNTFKTPEQVVEYYCARDAAGFVWSGLLDSERKAFTLWKYSPSHDSFQVARKYKISPAKYVNSTSTEAIVDVSYEVMGTSDAHGTWVPAKRSEASVRFGLRKINGLWKINSPSPSGISPVVVHGLFPYTAPAR